MGIPESKFEDWNGTGADNGSAQARRMVYNALRSERSPLEQKGDKYQVYLQGSYANTTHTWGSSDIDVVAKLISAWGRDLSELSPAEEERYLEDHSEAEYGYNEFRDHVHTALKTKFGRRSLTWDDKAIKISSDRVASLSVDVDVVPCSEYRVYHEYPDKESSVFTSGMSFEPRYGSTEIVNFPKLHIENGARKWNNTSENYKETVRIFKNARDYINKKRVLFSLDAPSYFIECLLYNVDNELFKTTNMSDRFIGVLETLEDRGLDGFQQQSRMLDLFGRDSTQWSTSEAETYIDALRDLWDSW